tara:strand:+ start:1916 stop:3232 length:1317 start_codon:yes stop_codon:yes gene_type:complete
MQKLKLLSNESVVATIGHSLILAFDKLLGFFTTFAIIQKYGEVNLGLYSQLLYLITLCLQLFTFNAPIGFLTTVGNFQDSIKRQAFIIKAMILTIFPFSVGIIIFTIFQKSFISFLLKGQSDNQMWIFVVVILCVELFTELFIYIYRGLGNLFYANIAAMVRSSSRLFLLLSIILVSDFRDGLTVGSILASLHLLIPGIVFSAKVLKQGSLKVGYAKQARKLNLDKFFDKDIKKFIKICFSSFSASLISSLFFLGTRTVMTKSLDLDSIGSYALLVTIGSSLMLLVQIVGFSFYPKIIMLCDKRQFRLSYLMNIRVSMSLVLLSIILSILVVIINSNTSVINVLMKSSYYTLLPISILSYGFLGGYQLFIPRLLKISSSKALSLVEITAATLSFVFLCVSLFVNGPSLQLFLISLLIYSLSCFILIVFKNLNSFKSSL